MHGIFGWCYIWCTWCINESYWWGSFINQPKSSTIRVLARPYLMMLYVIFPVYLNFPMRSRSVLKAIIHRRKQWIVLWILEKVFSFSKRCFLWYCTCMRYLISFFILSWSFHIFHVSFFIIYLLFLSYHVLYAWFFFSIFKGSTFKHSSFNVLNIWKNLLF